MAAELSLGLRHVARTRDRRQLRLSVIGGPAVR